MKGARNMLKVNHHTFGKQIKSTGFIIETPEK